MESALHILFPPFRLDLINEQLWCDVALVPVRPKPFAVLRYLVEHAGRLVSRVELRKAIWPNTYVNEGALRVYIRELRAVLGDDVETPRFIETMAGRGYRFIAPITTAPPVQGSDFTEQRLDSIFHMPRSAFVGREAELAQLQEMLNKARQGKRQVMFVTGEPGIGKTSLVEAFLAQAEASGDLWIGRGQCVEHYGAGEAYLPVLEMLGQLCRQSGGERLIEILGRYAPTWLVQMPALIGEAELEVLQRKVQGAARERMLREMAEAVEALTTERSLVLVLEDLQWSDYSTLDLMSVLARRREAARLLRIGTYRPAETGARGHPLAPVKQELHAHGQCAELPLGSLTAAAVNRYLAARFPQSSLPAALGQMLQESTDGNPLFIVNVAEEWASQGVLVETKGRWQLAAQLETVRVAVPENVRQLVERQLERLTPEEQRMLEVASVVGGEFLSTAVAAGAEEKLEQIEERCEELARRGQFVRTRGTETVPDGTVIGRYGFVHALYQQVLYERLAATRRVRLHRRIGEREEQTAGNRRGERAAELATHFERGQDYGRAVQYLQQAAENAVRKHAYPEAITLLTKGLELLKTLPETPERIQHEITLSITLGAPLIATKGYAAPEVGRALTRARELCLQMGETLQLFPALVGLWRFYLAQAEHGTARELAEQLLRLAQSVGDPTLLLAADVALGVTLFFLGEFPQAQEHLEQCTLLYDPQQHHFLAFFYYGDDPGVGSLGFATWTLGILGYPEQALKRSDQAKTLAQRLSHPFSQTFVQHFTAFLYKLRREVSVTREQAEAEITLASEQGFPFWIAGGTIFRGWALTEEGQGEEGISQIRQGLTGYRAIGAELALPYWLALLAEAYGKVGQAEEGLAALTEALAAVDKSGERWWEAELYRLKGELTLAQSSVQSLASSVQKEAEECFLRAIEIARRQQAKSLELRAVMSFARLWQSQGEQEKARTMLAEIYGWFTEGFDTKDLQEAKALLEELS